MPVITSADRSAAYRAAAHALTVLGATEHALAIEHLTAEADAQDAFREKLAARDAASRARRDLGPLTNDLGVITYPTLGSQYRRDTDGTLLVRPLTADPTDQDTEEWGAVDFDALDYDTALRVEQVARLIPA